MISKLSLLVGLVIDLICACVGLLEVVGGDDIGLVEQCSTLG